MFFNDAYQIHDTAESLTVHQTSGASAPGHSPGQSTEQLEAGMGFSSLNSSTDSDEALGPPNVRSRCLAPGCP